MYRIPLVGVPPAPDPGRSAPSAAEPRPPPARCDPSDGRADHRAAQFELSRAGAALGRVREVLLDDPVQGRALLADLATGVRAHAEQADGLAKERLTALAERLELASHTGSLSGLDVSPGAALPSLQALFRARRARGP